MNLKMMQSKNEIKSFAIKQYKLIRLRSPEEKRTPLAFHVKLDEARGDFAVLLLFVFRPPRQVQGNMESDCCQPLARRVKKFFAILHHVSFLGHLKKFLRVYKAMPLLSS